MPENAKTQSWVTKTVGQQVLAVVLLLSPHKKIV